MPMREVTIALVYLIALATSFIFEYCHFCTYASYDWLADPAFKPTMNDSALARTKLRLTQMINISHY